MMRLLTRLSDTRWREAAAARSTAAAAPGQEAPILDATNRLTDAELCHGGLRVRLQLKPATGAP